MDQNKIIIDGSATVAVRADQSAEAGKGAAEVRDGQRENSQGSAPIGIGSVLQGRYKIIDTLGKGGFGSVYKVSDLRLPGKFWALKELQFADESQKDEAKRSFEREARLLSSLIHSSLPVIIDYFSEDNRTYILMEEIEGVNLAQWVEKSGAPKEFTVMQWALEIAKVLEFLHGQEPPIIFRDLKPENVMINHDGHIKLIDFGLARFFEEKKQRDTAAVGSVGYSAPEVWEDKQQTDARTDIYSFGATLYFLLTGKPPSPVYGRHDLRPYGNINPKFADIVLKCMQIKPEDRYQDMGSIIKELLVIMASSVDEEMRAALQTEAFYRNASQSISKLHSAVRAEPKPAARQAIVLPVRASKTPKWSLAVLLIVTALFIIGAVKGYQSNNFVTIWEFDTPYELVNEDKEEARAYISSKDWPKAIYCLDRAVTRHPSDAEAHIMRSNVSVFTADRKYFRVPVLLATSGVNAPESYRLLYGIAMAQEEFNKSGGDKNGRHAVIDIFNDKSSMETTAQMARQIVDDKDYSVIIGPFSSQFSLALSPFFNAREMPILTPVVSAPDIWNQGEYIFTASDTNKARCRIIAQYLLQNNLRSVAVVVDQDSILSVNVADYFKQSFTEGGGKIACDLSFVNVKFDKVIDSIEASQADCVFFSDYRGTPLAMFSKELRRRGVNVPIASQVAPFTKDLLAVGGKSVEGLILSGYFHRDSQAPKTKDYVARFRRLFGGLSPSHLDASAYDAAEIVLSAYKKGVDTRKGMRDYLASIGTKADSSSCWEGATGRFSLAECLDMRDIYLIQVHNGNYDIIKVFKKGEN
ncbi:ABC transporter substrate-binding protein [bacterium]|nr:ABC transporter substrate-binding protein [bacterium]